MNGGLVVLHIDGLSAGELRRAVDQGLMPRTKALREEEDYQILPYHAGIPSTTPAAQAGILYGDSREIPGFRWWDRKAGMIIQFGAQATFRQVAHRYFKGAEPLCERGASIAACYPAGAAETFGLTYRDRSYRGGPGGDRSAGDVLRPWLKNPVHLADMIAHGSQAVAETAAADLQDRSAGKRPARTYVISDMLEEVFLHHLTRYAARRAMDQGYPAIYAAFYAYDETGHGFGPTNEYTRRMLTHVDHSIATVCDRRRDNDSGRQYELVVLSDHGQVETVPLREVAGTALGELIAGWLPGCRIEEHNGGAWGPAKEPITRILLTHSGGLSHLYLAEFADRLGLGEFRRRFPTHATQLAGVQGVGFVLGRDGDTNVLITPDREQRFERSPGDAAELLAAYGDPALLARQLDRLNSFENSGDLILVGDWDGRRQINFENQVGGHGSIGGSQTEPFLFAARRWGLDTSTVEGGQDIHPLLLGMRRQLAGR